MAGSKCSVLLQPANCKGFQLSVLPSHHYKQTYHKSDLEYLIAEFDISNEHANGFLEFLEDAAAICRWHRPTEEGHIPPAKVTNALKKVAKYADQLNSALIDLPFPAQTALSVEHSNISIRIIKSVSDGSPLPKGVTEHNVHSAGSSYYTLPDTAEIIDIVAHLSEMATKASARPSGKAGSKRDNGLRMWILNIERFWTETLGRSFTRDVTSTGEPISEAARFCVAAFKPVCSKTPPSRVLQEMKVRIQDQRRNSTGRVTPKNDT